MKTLALLQLHINLKHKENIKKNYRRNINSIKIVNKNALNQRIDRSTLVQRLQIHSIHFKQKKTLGFLVENKK